MPEVKSEKLAKLPTFSIALPWILIIGGVIGLICSMILSHDEIGVLKNPNFHLNCNLNPVIACGSVMQSSQAHILQYLPNPLIGLVAFPALLTVGVALLAGAKFRKWFWRLLEIGAFLGLIFVHWLFFETVYRIHALCPYCMGVWVVTITVFLYLTLYNLCAGNIFRRHRSSRFVAFIARHHLDILFLWFLIITALILKHFWYYYGHYF